MDHVVGFKLLHIHDWRYVGTAKYTYCPAHCQIASHPVALTTDPIKTTALVLPLEKSVQLLLLLFNKEYVFSEFLYIYFIMYQGGADDSILNFIHRCIIPWWLAILVRPCTTRDQNEPLHLCTSKPHWMNYFCILKLKQGIILQHKGEAILPNEDEPHA